MSGGKAASAPLVAVDARKIDDSGIGTYIRSIVPRVARLLPRARFALLGSPARLRPEIGGLANCEIVDCPARSLSLREQAALPRRVPPGAALYWATHFNIPLLYRGPLLVTIHDVLPLAGRAVGGGGARAGYVRAMTAAMSARRARVVSVSRFTTGELARLTPIRAEQIVTIPEGVDSRWSRVAASRRPRERRYLLYVGLVKAHKNLPALLRAFGSVAAAHPDVDLVIVGDRDKIRSRDEAAAALAARHGARVEFTGWVEAAALEQYVAFADALVVPSLYEGFGLPALEAMACGCPVVASRAASLPEVCGDAALYFDPRDPSDIAAALQRLLADPLLAEGMRRLGRANALRFDWDAAAARTAGVIEELLRGAS